MQRKFLALLSIFILLFSACYTTSVETRTMWADNPSPPENAPRGRVEWIRETVQHTEGDPAAGAAAGAVVGGFLGGMLTGRGAGALFGAATGAMIGAGSSRGHGEYRSYDVAVRFDDGAVRVFRYRGYPPFKPGQPVALTGHGLIPLTTFVKPPSPPPVTAPPPESPAPSTGDQTEQPAPPQPGIAPAPPQSPQGEPASASEGEWSYTQQYGWVWMPYGGEYTFTPDYENGEPYMYVYYPSTGWTWVEAPWLWGWGPVPFFAAGGGAHFIWYGHGWGDHWSGHRPTRYHYHYRHR